ncbi:MAG: alpha/beta hydrolase [Patescibacteria group bacterium]|jgi:pimeloyl-ACP methyl ester carboxylesterase
MNTKKLLIFILLSIVLLASTSFFILTYFSVQDNSSNATIELPEPVDGIREGDIITSDGVRLHYWFYDRGTDTVTIFLHGGPGHGSEDFRTIQAQAYADMFGSLIVYDQRGCGESQHTSDLADSMTFARAVADINELREQIIPGKPIVIFGRSFGGLLAAKYANSQPENVSGYILVAPGTFSKEISDQGGQLLIDLQRAETDKIGEDSISQAIGAEHVRVGILLHQDFSVSEFVENPENEVLSEEEILAQQNEQEVSDLKDAYHTNEPTMFVGNDYPLLLFMSELPVLVVSGEYDTVVPPLAIDEMKPYLPNATFLQLAKGWHFAAYDQQEVFFSAVREFFTKYSILEAHEKNH